MSARTFSFGAAGMIGGLGAILMVASAPAAAQTTVEHVVSDTGIEAYLVESDAVPVLSLEFTFRGGVETDPPGKEGRANMVSALLDEGAGDLDSQEFQQRLGDLSVSMRFNAGFDGFGGSLYSTTEVLDEAAELLALALTEPRFDEGPVERMRDSVAASIRSTVTDPGWLSRRALYDEIFADHPYRNPSRGTMATLQNLTAEDFHSFVDERFARDNLVVAAAGDITPDELGRLLDTIFGDLPQSADSRTEVQWTMPEDPARIVVDRPGAQSLMVLAQPGVAHGHDDYYATVVMNHILGGGGFGSRLSEEVRERRGLTYGIQSFLFNTEQADMLMVQSSLAHENVAPALDLILAEWRRMRDEGVTEEELDAAKRFITGSFPLNLTSTSQIASMLRTMQVRDLGIDYLEKRNDLIEAVTVEDVNRVAADLLDPDRLSYTVVGQPGDDVPFEARLDARELAERELAEDTD